MLYWVSYFAHIYGVFGWNSFVCRNVRVTTVILQLYAALLTGPCFVSSGSRPSVVRQCVQDCMHWAEVLNVKHIAHLRQECHNSKFDIFWINGIERNFCRSTFNRYSVITQFAKLAAGEQLCRRCTHRKL